MWVKYCDERLLKLAILYVLARTIICMPLALGSIGIDQMGLFFI